MYKHSYSVIDLSNDSNINNISNINNNMTLVGNNSPRSSLNNNKYF